MVTITALSLMFTYWQYSLTDDRVSKPDKPTNIVSAGKKASRLWQTLRRVLLGRPAEQILTHTFRYREQIVACTFKVFLNYNELYQT